MIKLIGVSKKYKSNTLYKNLNAEFNDGRIIMIKGPNGSGKSVLLKLITGYSKCDSGLIEVDGKILHRDIDFIPDSGVFIDAPEFMANKSGFENLLYLAKIRNVVNKEEILTYAKIFHIDNQIYEPVRKYSLGMKQKLRIIQAIMDEPKYLIMDEPFDSLDIKTITLVKKIITLYKSNEKTIVFTNHINGFDNFVDEIYEIENCNLSRKLNAIT